MSITSFTFILFVIGVFLIYFILPQKIKPIFLLVASLFFYFTWRKWAPFFIIFFALFVYIAAHIMAKQQDRRRLFLFSSICIVLGGFVLLRYTDLPAQMINIVTFPLTGINPSIIFPLGFSYYMFKSISYLIDVYYEKITPEKRFDYLLLHFCYFPEITMGPISRASDFLPQIRTEKKYNSVLYSQTFLLILFGYFKKLVLADRLSIYIAPLYEDVSLNGNGLSWIIISFTYLIQLYLDFSGYTDVSVGISLILGYKIKHNFNAPYLSKTLSEFWRNWHMSFSHWLADYIFKPLQHKWRKYGIYASVFAALITLTVSSFWHGISGKYLIFGVSMGLIISIDSLFAKKRNKLQKELPKNFMSLISVVITLSIISILFIFTRAAGAHSAFVIIHDYILDPTTWSLDFELGIKYFIVLAFGILVTALSHYVELYREKAYKRFFDFPIIFRWAVYYGLIFAVIIFQVQGSDLVKGFVYAQF